MANKLKRWCPLLIVLPATFGFWFFFWRPAGIQKEPQGGIGPVDASSPSLQTPSRDGPRTAYGRSNQDGDSDTGYMLTGKVISENEQPLLGAIVSLYRPSPGLIPTVPRDSTSSPFALAACDKEGNYVIRARSWPLNPIVLVNKEGYAAIEGPLILSFDEHAKMVRNFRLEAATACIEGTALASDGTPVSGAAVSTSGPILSLTDATFSKTSSTMTGNSGNYILGALPQGATIVTVSAQKFFLQSRGVTLKAGPCARVDFRLEPAVAFSMILKNERGTAIPGPKINFGASKFRIEWQQSMDGMSVECKMESGEEPVQCVVGARGYKNKSLVLDPTAPPSEIILEAAEWISGRVISESGAPVGAANVQIRGADSAETDQDGRFSIPAKNPPEYQITVRKIGYAEQRLTLNKIPPCDMEIRLQQADSGVYGRLVDDTGKPVRIFSMTFWGLSNPANLFTRRFDREEGRFSVTDVPPGLYRITFATDNYTVTTMDTGIRVIGRSSLYRQATIEQIEIKKGQYHRELVVVAK